MARADRGMDAAAIEDLTRRWITVWTDGDPFAFPLAADFEHTSPYGTIRGRDRYLETVVPAAKANVMTLTVESVIVSGDEGAVRYRMEGPSGGVTEACDWLRFERGALARVWSYYERHGPDET